MIKLKRPSGVGGGDFKDEIKKIREYLFQLATELEIAISKNEREIELNAETITEHGEQLEENEERISSLEKAVDAL